LLQRAFQPDPCNEISPAMVKVTVQPLMMVVPLFCRFRLAEAPFPQALTLRLAEQARAGVLGVVGEGLRLGLLLVREAAGELLTAGDVAG
jgi:hypothetical protein